jgi:hypothetical protein
VLNYRHQQIVLAINLSNPVSGPAPNQPGDAGGFDAPEGDFRALYFPEQIALVSLMMFFACTRSAPIRPKEACTPWCHRLGSV